MSSRGSLSNLRPVPQAVRPQPGPGQARIRGMKWSGPVNSNGFIGQEMIPDRSTTSYMNSYCIIYIVTLNQ